MRRLFLYLMVVAASLAGLGPLRAAPAPSISIGMPSEFADLAQDRRIVADFFFGGKRIGQFEIDTIGSNVRILHPDQLVAAIPGVRSAGALTAALSGPLSANSQLVCAETGTTCARPTPETAMVVFDQARFRVDLYVAPRLLTVRAAVANDYLRPAARRVSLIDTVGGALSGGDGQPILYNLRNRIVLAAGEGRLISEASLGSGRRADIDTTALQLDKPGLRYTAGLFYAPGADLVGRRRIVGAGLATQLDTRADRTLISGTPLVVFLAQRSRVDLLVENRLISSHVYEAGNQALDTSSLPDGSYPVEIRILENSGAARSERRFFTKNSSIPPAGRTFFFANAGVLALDRPDRVFDVTKFPIVVAGAARRMGSHVAWDTTLTGTRERGLGELGLTVFTKAFQSRVAALGSSRGDYGAMLQLTSASGGKLGYSFDLRRVVSRDNKPLVPLDDFSSSLLATDNAAQQSVLVGTTFTQAASTITYRVGRAQLGVSAYIRRDVGHATTYTVGPIVHWPIVQRQNMQLSFDGSYAKTDHGRSAAFGLHLRIFGPRSSIGGTVGGQTTSLGDRQRIGAVAEVNGSKEIQSERFGQITAAANLQHSGDGTLGQVSVDDRGPYGYGSASLLRRAGGGGQSGSQYALSFQTTVAAARDTVHVGARSQTDSVIIVSLGGTARDTRFEVLLDDAPAAIVRPGGQVSLSVTPYRRYTLRLKPIGGALVSFDAKPRVVDVFPGTVAKLPWKADPAVAMFGRLVRPDGLPIASADIIASDAISASDDRGFFQVQTAGNAPLLAHLADGTTCRAMLAAARTEGAYTALGDVKCQP